MAIFYNNLQMLQGENIMMLLESIPDIQFWIKDTTGRFILFNTAFLQALGFSLSKELMGKTDFDVSPYPLAKEYVADDEQVISTAKPILNKMELVRSDGGKLLQYSTSKIPLKKQNGEVWGTMGYTRRIAKSNNSLLPIRGINDIARHINNHFDQPLTVKEMAKMANLSVVQFERNFKKAFHVSPNKYLNMIRIKAACRMLSHTSLSIGKISQKTGYNDQSYFTKQFAKQMGTSPKDYRSSHLGSKLENTGY